MLLYYYYKMYRVFLLVLCFAGVSMSVGFNNVLDSDEDNIVDQVNLLTKQMNLLLNKRKEDLRILDSNFNRNIKKNAEIIELKNEVAFLRQQINKEPAKIHFPGSSSNNEQLTINWLTETISELRGEINEVQRNYNASVILQEKEELKTEMNLLKTNFDNLNNDFRNSKMKILELEELLKEAQEDVKENQIKIAQVEWKSTLQNSNLDYHNVQAPGSHADMRIRHNRYLKKQIHDLQVANHRLQENQRELEQKIQSISIQPEIENVIVEKLESEHKKIAESNFNLTRQVVGLDKLHISMLELLETVENLENKIDKNLPEFKKEISKLEFSNAQIVSEQNLLKEDGDNVKNSMKAVVVSVSNLMDTRDVIKSEMLAIKESLEKLQAGESHHKERLVNRINKIEEDSKLESGIASKNKTSPSIPQLVQQLETVEREYQDIVNKLPQDCSEVTGPSGLYLISPGPGQPIMTYCDSKWTTIQRRFDGSVDFNRNWEEYSAGFGNPSTEYWIGNEALNRLSSNNCSTLKIVMSDIYDNIWTADYKEFKVGNKAEGYKIEIGEYNGNASDALDYQNRMQFSAIDDDRDISNTHCAGNYEGGWWFSHCQHANLNGRYNLGLTWFDSGRNEWIAVKNSHMMVGRKDHCH